MPWFLGSETPSRVLDFTDRNTCVLFGDGAAAAVLELSAENPYYAICGSRTDNEQMLYCTGLADEQPGVVHMQGQEVFRFAVDIIPHSIEQLLDKCGLQLADIDHVICHQANNRIISHVVKRCTLDRNSFSLICSIMATLHRLVFRWL